MKKVALVFVLAVFVPSLVLAWLAVRSLRDQQFLLERQQSLLYQGVADALAKDVEEKLADYQRNFTARTMALLREHRPQDLANSFDEVLRKDWPLAQVGFVVTLSGNILCPAPLGPPDARAFLTCNSRFLANRESAEVYWSAKNAGQNFPSDFKKSQSTGAKDKPSDSTSNINSMDFLKTLSQSKSLA